ncbi:MULTISPECIES: hypothetical protein [Streptomyces]|uniref:Uncharacterized protein n=1 Tax=Streptomyces antibioticus TaxID=1890 RepID=A0AAE7CKX9_STRAT|nr:MULTISPECIES: hypothetical protein [Streptomyces]MCX4738590.1 hypothetical protein [Streptomyces antibioticus]MCX5169613.1 hypothetical protein [Streptomyces antibioticus]OOQ50893.1 hypothetical protein AFM16_16695 [Streptomyces antibioticus]QIT45036.1 hypothetical protein HCX60_16980 [Streptomyces antibioticus]SMF57711.1 hypothetical protein SAMN02745830_04549 [Streptomyces sp. Amel2xC10]
MPLHLTISQLTGMTFLALASIAWLIGMNRMLRRFREEAAANSARAARPAHPAYPTLPALPSQLQPGPHREAVELTPAEQDAFAGLVRQLGDGRPDPASG